MASEPDAPEPHYEADDEPSDPGLDPLVPYEPIRSITGVPAYGGTSKEAEKLPGISMSGVTRASTTATAASASAISGMTYPSSTTTVDTIPWPGSGVGVDPSRAEAQRILGAPGSIVIDPEDGDTITAKFLESSLVCGKGDTPSEAIDDLQESLRSLLDFVYGADGGTRPTLHPDFLADVTRLIEYAKGIGIYTP